MIEAFLREHGEVSATLGRLLSGLSDAELRSSIAGLNPIAWILWHMTRVEDANLATCVFDVEQVLDAGGWGSRLGVATRSNGFRMPRAEAIALAGAIDLDALRAYREAVFERTRSLAAGLWPAGWNEPITVVDVDRVAREGYGHPDVGETREALLLWWGVEHNFWHLGQIAAIRGLIR